MDTQFFFKNISQQEKREVEDYVDSKLGYLNKLLTHVPIDEQRLEVRVEKFVKKSAYRLEFALLMPIFEST